MTCFEGGGTKHCLPLVNTTPMMITLEIKGGVTMGMPLVSSWFHVAEAAATTTAVLPLGCWQRTDHGDRMQRNRHHRYCIPDCQHPLHEVGFWRAEHMPVQYSTSDSTIRDIRGLQPNLLTWI